MQNEYIDLPINIQQTPKNLLDKVPAYKVPQKPEQAADELLKNLETLLKGSQTDLYTFYQTAMVSTYKQRFADKQWPTISSLEQSLDTQYKAGAQTIYKQFALRTWWNKIKYQKDVEKYWDIIDEAWEEYTFIFKLELGRINFPPEMIWDYFDNFLEIYFFHKAKAPTIAQSPKAKKQLFDTKEIKTMFKEISATIPSNFNTNCTTKQIFAYYSLVALSVIAVCQGNYKQALSYISKISLKQTLILSKGLGSLLTTFFIASFSHFMLEQYYKSAKLCETIVPFYLKYRKYFDKSFSFFSQLQPIYEKLVILQCINYVFLEEKPKTTVMQIFKNTNVKTKEKQARDKISECFYKMKQSDLTTFLRLFNFLCSQYSIANVQKIVTQRFKNLQSVNINTIIQNYKRIQLQKMAKMLNKSTDQVLKQIRSLGAVQKTQSPWDSTVMNPLLKQKKKVNVLIEGNVAIFDSQSVDPDEASRQWKRYRQEIAWLNQKVKVL